MFDLVSADVLCNTTCFTGNNIRFANGIKQRRFAMINMTHDRNDWWAWLKIGILIRRVKNTFFDGKKGDIEGTTSKIDCARQ